MINALRNYFLDCPLLRDGVNLNVDFLSVNGVEYTINTTPYNPIKETYIDGTSIRQCDFIFASREYYNNESNQNLDNLKFYENLSDWILSNNRKGILPTLPSGKIAEEIEVLTAGYLFDENQKTARYQIQCRLTYLQESE